MSLSRDAGVFNKRRGVSGANSHKQTRKNPDRASAERATATVHIPGCNDFPERRDKIKWRSYIQMKNCRSSGTGMRYALPPILQCVTKFIIAQAYKI
jgi:hypothetical protein